MNNRCPKGEKRHSRRQCQEEQRTQGAGERSLNVSHTSLLKKASHGGKDDRGNAEGEHPVRQHHELPCVIQRGDSIVADLRGKVGDDDEVDLECGLTDNAWQEEPADLGETLNANREMSRVTHSRAKEAGNLDAHVSERTGDHAGCQTIHAPEWGEDERSDDDSQVVDERREGGQQEAVLRFQDALCRDAKSEEYRREKQDAHRLRGKLLKLRGEARRHKIANDRFGEHEDDGR